MKVMILDDSAVMRKIIRKHLEDADVGNIDAIEAADGAEAWKKFSPEIDLILADWNMPNMNGLDFVRRVRKKAKKRVPIIMVTTEGGVSKLEEAFDAGVDAYICKPFTAQNIKAKVTHLMENTASGF